jgi:hypothetical protein
MRLDAASRRRTYDLRRTTFMARAACPARDYLPGYAGSIRPQARNIPSLDGAARPVAYHPNGKGSRVSAIGLLGSVKHVIKPAAAAHMRTEPALQVQGIARLGIVPDRVVVAGERSSPGMDVARTDSQSC